MQNKYISFEKFNLMHYLLGYLFKENACFYFMETKGSLLMHLAHRSPQHLLRNINSSSEKKKKSKVPVLHLLSEEGTITSPVKQL